MNTTGWIELAMEAAIKAEMAKNAAPGFQMPLPDLHFSVHGAPWTVRTVLVREEPSASAGAQHGVVIGHANPSPADR